MSVAFRRESDDEHREPRFELPIPPGPNLVTPRGYALIADRTAALEIEVEGAPTERREELLRDLRYWRNRLAAAQVVPAPDGTSVAIGTRVTFDQGGRRRTVDIVGHDESEPDAGRIAFSAPLAQALIGAEPGDDAEAPNGEPVAIVAAQPIPG